MAQDETPPRECAGKGQKTEPWLAGLVLVLLWILPCFFLFALLIEFCKYRLLPGAILGMPITLWLGGVLIGGWRDSRIRALLTSVAVEILMIHILVIFLGAVGIFHLQGEHRCALAFIGFAVWPAAYLFTWPGVGVLIYWHHRRPLTEKKSRWIRELLVLSAQAALLRQMIPA